MKDVMLEIMDEYDTDGNKLVDLDEFMLIVSDSDVDMLLSLYWYSNLYQKDLFFI